MGRADSTQDAQKIDFLTRQTPADTSPARPEAVKTASSPTDTLFRRQGRSDQLKIVLPSLLGYSTPGWLRMSPPCARPLIFSAPFQYPAKQGREELLTAAVERGPSEGARSGSKESSSRPCATPSEAARCASTRIVPATPSPLFSILLEVHPELGIRPILIGAGAQVLLDILAGEEVAIASLEG